VFLCSAPGFTVENKIVFVRQELIAFGVFVTKQMMVASYLLFYHVKITNSQDVYEYLKINTLTNTIFC